MVSHAIPKHNKNPAIMDFHNMGWIVEIEAIFGPSTKARVNLNNALPSPYFCWHLEIAVFRLKLISKHIIDLLHFNPAELLCSDSGEIKINMT